MKIPSELTVFAFTCFWAVVLSKKDPTETPIEEFEAAEEMTAEESHKVGSLNLFIFMVLLILTVLTTWLFKHHRFRFIHETGLAVIYGLIVGVMIRYLGSASERTSAIAYIDNSTGNAGDEPPILLRLNLSTKQSGTKYFQYEYQREVNENNVGEKELEEKATFDPEIFFNVLLPPIIFNAGYSMKRKSFFKNFGAIMAFAFGGTLISALAVAAVTYGFSLAIPNLVLKFTDCLHFGAIISATDPVTVLAIFSDLHVDVDLYALVFGESVLNDAVAIVLASTIEHYSSSSSAGFDGMALLGAIWDFIRIFMGAFLLGSGMGMLNALITKFTRLRDHPLLETSLFFCMSYGTFLAAEAAGMTGIVAVLFCGICQAHYTYNNLSTESKQRTKELFELLNFLMENFVFCYIGVSTFTYLDHRWDFAFIAVSFLAIIIGRACNIYPLSFLLNLGRSNKIRYNFQHMMMFSGLRGAIAFALAIRTTNSETEKLMFSTTLVIVITTVVLCGGLTTQMLEWLKIRVGVEDEPTELQQFEAVNTRQQTYNSIEDAAGSIGHIHASIPSSTGDTATPSVQTAPSRLSEKALLVKGWYKIDARIVKPLLTHAKPPLTETMPTCCLPLAKLLTTEEQYSREDADGEDSDSDLIDDVELHYGEHNGGAAQTVVAPGFAPSGNDSSAAAVTTTPPKQLAQDLIQQDDDPLDLDITLDLTTDTTPLCP